jgi:hypothetical protein
MASVLGMSDDAFLQATDVSAENGKGVTKHAATSGHQRLQSARSIHAGGDDERHKEWRERREGMARNKTGKYLDHIHPCRVRRGRLQRFLWGNLSLVFGRRGRFSRGCGL